MQSDLKKDILARYKELGGCKDIYRDLTSAADKAALVDVYIKHPDWCMELNFPSLNALRTHFKDQESKHIYIDRTFNGEVIDFQTAIFHHCDGYINVAMDYKDAVIPMLYFCNGCEIHIECRQANTPALRVSLYIFGDNLITTNGRGNAIFNRHNHDVS